MMMMMRTMFSSRNVLLAGKKNLAHLKWEAALRFVLPLRRLSDGSSLTCIPMPSAQLLLATALGCTEQSWELRMKWTRTWSMRTTWNETDDSQYRLKWDVAEQRVATSAPGVAAALQSSKTLEQPDKDKLLSKISSSKWLHFKCMEYGQWIQSRILCCSVLWSQFLRGLNGKKMLEFYTSWVGEWSIDKIA